MSLDEFKCNRGYFMLKNTFTHIPGIGVKTEERLWESGILNWNDFTGPLPIKLSQNRMARLKPYIRDSREHLKTFNPKYFENLLPSNLHWRMFPEFRDSTVYLDIETTGLDSWGSDITSIALYDGESIFYYVNGKNLDDFTDDIQRYKVIVTYNGKSFDIPFIESYFGINIPHAHIDLRYILASLGYRGGLKGCEKQLGIARGDLEDLDGYFAVLLWDEFQRNKNQKALETLLAYNIEDTVNLETLMVMAYNMKLRDTPFLKTHQLSMPSQPDIPFEADRRTIESIRGLIFDGTTLY
jgi:uncharacterized protein YprB with RNaseH-like and TPR domain